MEFVITENLSEQQLAQARELIDSCKKYDKTKGIFFLESDINYFKFPAFFMLYDNNKLVSMLSVFMVCKNECELYAVTLPQYRRQGCFRKLFDEAVKRLREYDVEDILCVCEPISESGKKALEKIGACYYASEYLLAYNTQKKAQPKGILKLKILGKENILFETYKKNTLIGRIHVESKDKMASIYNVEVLKEYSGKGYGTETLLLVIEYLLRKGYQTIMLHVSSQNKAAYALYTHYGFEAVQEIENWKI